MKSRGFDRTAASRLRLVVAAALVALGSSAGLGAEVSGPLTFEIRDGFFREIAVGSAGSGPAIVSVDAQDSVWVAVAREGRLVRFQNGRTDSFPLGEDSRPVGVVAGRPWNGNDGVLWIAASFDNKLLRFDPASGDVREFPIGGDASWPFNVALAPSGDVWFTQRASGRVGRLDPDSGEVVQFDPPTPGSGPAGLGIDPESGIVWFTESYADRIGRLDPATGEIQELVMGEESSGLARGPAGLAVDPEGGVWFAKLEGKLGHVAPGSEEVEVFDLPPAVRRPAGVAAAPDGTVWVAALDGNQLVHYDPARRHLEIFPIPTGEPDPEPTEPPAAHTSRPFGIAVDSRGNVWFSEQYTGQLGVLDTSPPVVEIVSPGPNPVQTASVLVTTHIEDRVAGVERVEYRLDGRAVRLEQGRLSLAELPPGLKVLEVRAVDRAGSTRRVEREIDYRPSHLAVLELLRGLEPRNAGAAETLEELRRLADGMSRQSPVDVEPLRAALDGAERLFRGFSRASFRAVLEGIDQAPSRNVEVEILDAAPFFAPEHLEIRAGETVRWSYKPPSDGHSISKALHRIEVPAPDGSVQSPLLKAGESFSYTFERSGTFAVQDSESDPERAEMRVVVR